MNGFNGFSAATDMPIVLNISNPASITYVEKYTDPNVLLAQAKNDAQSSNNQQSSNGLSSGAIAGIAVGAAVVVSPFLFVAKFLCLPLLLGYPYHCWHRFLVA